MVGAAAFAVSLLAYVAKIYQREKNAQKQRLHRMIAMTEDHIDKSTDSGLMNYAEKIGETILTLPGATKLRLLFPKTKEQTVPGIKPAHLVVLNLLMLLIAYNFSKITQFNYIMSLLILVSVEALAIYIVGKRQKKMRDLVEEHLSEILDTMARVYKAHPDLRVAIEEVTHHIREPLVRQKFENILKLSRFGYTIEDSIALLAKELQSSDLEFVVSSIKLNKPLGGNLSSQFERIAEILRQRKATTTEINNVMFQNKVSAIISAGFVPVIMVVSFSSNPDAKQHLIEDPTGRIIFTISIFWWLIGLYLIRRATRIKI